MLADTAGLRDSADVMQQEGLRRALKRAEEAELRLFVFDAGRPEDAAGAAAWPGPDTLLVANKIDLAADHSAVPLGAIPISALTGEGIPELIAALAGRIAETYDIAAPLLTRARHREALEL